MECVKEEAAYVMAGSKCVVGGGHNRERTEGQGTALETNS